MKRTYSKLQRVDGEEEPTHKRRRVQRVISAANGSCATFILTDEQSALIAHRWPAELLALVAMYSCVDTCVLMSALCKATREAVLFAEAKRHNCSFASRNAKWHFAVSLYQFTKLVQSNCGIGAEPFCVNLDSGLFQWRPLPPLPRDGVCAFALTHAWRCQLPNYVSHLVFNGDNLLVAATNFYYRDSQRTFFVDASNGIILCDDINRRLERIRFAFVDKGTLVAVLRGPTEYFLRLYSLNNDGSVNDMGTFSNFPKSIFYIGSMKLSPRGDKLFLAVSGIDGYQILVFSTTDWTLARSIIFGSGNIENVLDVSSDGKLLAAAIQFYDDIGFDARIVDANTSKSVCTSLSFPGVKKDKTNKRLVAFSPDSKYLVVCGIAKNRVQLLDVATGQLVGGLRHRRADATLTGVLWVSNEVFVTTSKSGSIVQWHVASEEPVAVAEMETHITSALRLSDTCFVTVGNYRELNCWKVGATDTLPMEGNVS